MDFRLAAQPASPAVERSSFSDVSFLGDSLTQGMQLYDTGLPNAHFCAYKGVGPNAVVNNTTCRRADGEKEVPMEALASQQPRALYILLGTNVLTANSDYTSFLTYYRLMLDMISQALPNTKIYVQSITPVRPEVRKKSPGLYKERLCEINDALSAIALEKGCTFLNLWERWPTRTATSSRNTPSRTATICCPPGTTHGWIISAPTPDSDRTALSAALRGPFAVSRSERDAGVVVQPAECEPAKKPQNPRRGCCRRTAPWGGAGRSSSPAPGRLRR